jgi:putative oxidoreductase
MKYLHNGDIGILLIRIAIGVVFIAHGYQKLQNMTGVIGFFSSLGLSALVAYIVMIIEILGGIMVLLGIFVRPAAALISMVMVGALFTAKMGSSLLASQGKPGFELELTLLLCALSIVFLGAGKFSLLRIFRS